MLSIAVRLDPNDRQGEEIASGSNLDTAHGHTSLLAIHEQISLICMVLLKF